jgi:hypothetical protein
MRKADVSHGRDVIEINTQPRIADPFDQLAEEGEQAVVGDLLVIERRQGQHAGAAARHCGTAERDRVGQGAAAGAGKHASGRCAGVERGVQQADALSHG